MRLMRPPLAALLILVAGSAAAQDSTRRAPGATISGVVRDSIGRVALGGATVQLVAADGAAGTGRAAIADSLGRYAIADVPAGMYTMGFIHPLLDSLGIEPPTRRVHVAGRLPVKADLSTPSPAQMRAAICGGGAAQQENGVIAGVVRDSRQRAPVAGASVIGEWVEMTFSKDGMSRRLRHLAATTAENGWFAICSLPAGGAVALLASRGADSTDLVEVQIPSEGFLRRELYLGPARTIAAARDTARHADTLAPPPRAQRVGEGRLTGTVVTLKEGRPLSGARVGIADGPQTRTNERGEWTIADAPAGTRMLEVRAVGYYPERRPVDVVSPSAPIRVTLATFSAVLDTVRVTAARLRGQDLGGFMERRRMGIGRFFTEEDIARKQLLFPSDLFRTLPGVRMERDGIETRITMRSAFGGACTPPLFINGSNIAGQSANEIDDWVRTRDIVGIEIYHEGSVPQQYQLGLNPCGAVVIWTK